MKETQFFIEYIIVGAFASATISLAALAVFAPVATVTIELSTIEAAIIALLLPTLGLAIDCIGKTMLWGVDGIARLVHFIVRASARRLHEQVPQASPAAKILKFVEKHCQDEPKPDLSHAQMAKYDPEVVRQSEMRKSRERVARGAFASSVICGVLFWIGIKTGADFNQHLVMSIVAALTFGGAWFRYRRRVRVHRNDIVSVYASPGTVALQHAQLPIKAAPTEGQAEIVEETKTGVPRSS